MANQYSNLVEYTAYKLRISEYIAKELVSLPAIYSDFRSSPESANYSAYISKTGSSIQQWFQKTIKAGKVQKHRISDEPLVVFDDEKSSNLEDLEFLEYVAHRLAGVEPDLGLAVAIWKYAHPNITDGSQNSYTETLSSVITQYDYIPYLYIRSTQEKIILDPSRIPYILESRPTQYPSLESFTQQLTSDGFVFHPATGYNLQDNLSQFIPVAPPRRTVSRKALNDFSDTTITELIPDTNQARIKRFFDIWNKTKPIIPIGYQSTTGNNWIANPSLGGGIGPGIKTRNTDLTERAADQEILVKPNPGFSDFVLKQDGFSNSYYSITISTTANALLGDNTTYVASCWMRVDDTYTGTPEALFHIELNNPNEVTDDISVTNAPTTINQIKGELIIGGIWTDNSGNVWRQYKKVFTTPSQFSDSSTIVWKLGLGIQTTIDGGSIIYNVTNENDTAYRYITGLRLETGVEVQNLNKLQLTALDTQTIARVAKDCQSLMNPYDMPMFSWNDFDDFIEGTAISKEITNLYGEIKDGLIISLESITSGSSNAFANLANSLSENDTITAAEASTISSNFTTAATDVGTQINFLSAQISTLQNSFISSINTVGSAGTGGFGEQFNEDGLDGAILYNYTTFLTNPSPISSLSISKRMMTCYNGGGLGEAADTQLTYDSVGTTGHAARLNAIDGDYASLVGNNHFCFTSRPFFAQNHYNDTNYPLSIHFFDKFINLGRNQLGISMSAVYGLGIEFAPEDQPSWGVLSDIVTQNHPISADMLFHRSYGFDANGYLSAPVIPSYSESLNSSMYLYEASSWGYFNGIGGWAAGTLFENGISPEESGYGLETGIIQTDDETAGKLKTSKAYPDLVFKKWNAMRAARGLGTEVLETNKSVTPYLGPDGNINNLNYGGTYGPDEFPYVNDSNVIVTTHKHKPGEYVDIKVNIIPTDAIPYPTYIDKGGVQRDMIQSIQILLTGVDKRSYLTKDGPNGSKGFKFYKKTLFCYNAYHNGQSILDDDLKIQPAIDLREYDDVLKATTTTTSGGDFFTNQCPLIPGTYMHENYNDDYHYISEGGIRLLPLHLRKTVYTGEGLNNNRHTYLPFSQFHLTPIYGGLVGAPILETKRQVDLTQADIAAGETAYRIFRLRVQADIPTDTPIFYETKEQGQGFNTSPGTANAFFGHASTTPYIRYTNELNPSIPLEDQANDWAIKYMPSTKNPIWNILSRQWLGSSFQPINGSYDDTLEGTGETYFNQAGTYESAYNTYGNLENAPLTTFPSEQAAFYERFLGFSLGTSDSYNGQFANQILRQGNQDYGNDGFIFSKQRLYWNSLFEGINNTDGQQIDGWFALNQYVGSDFSVGNPFMDGNARIQVSNDASSMFSQYTDVMKSIFPTSPVWSDFSSNFNINTELEGQNTDFLDVKYQDFLNNSSFETYTNFNTGLVSQDNTFSISNFQGSGGTYDYQDLDGAHITGLFEQPQEFVVNCEFSIVSMLPCAEGSDIDWLGYTPGGRPIKGNLVNGGWTGETNPSDVNSSPIINYHSFKTSVMYNGAPFTNEHFQDFGVANRFGQVSSANAPVDTISSIGYSNSTVLLNTLYPSETWRTAAINANQPALPVIRMDNPVTGDNNHSDTNIVVPFGGVAHRVHPFATSTTNVQSSGGGDNLNQNNIEWMVHPDNAPVRATGGGHVYQAGQNAVMSTLLALQSQRVPGYHTIPPQENFDPASYNYGGINFAQEQEQLIDYTLDESSDNVVDEAWSPFNGWRLQFDLERAVSFGLLCDLWPYDTAELAGENTPLYRRIHNQVLWRYNWYGCGISPGFWRFKTQFAVDDEHYSTTTINGMLEYGAQGQGGGNNDNNQVSPFGRPSNHIDENTGQY